MAKAGQSEAVQYQIVDWGEHYETHATRKVKRLSWVLIPNTTGSGYFELIDAHGALGLGVWLALLQAASRVQRDSRDGRLPPEKTLSRVSGISSGSFQDVIRTLLQIGWVEEVTSHPDNIRTTSGRCPDSVRAKEGRKEGRNLPSEGGASPSALPGGGGGSSKNRAQEDIEPIPEWLHGDMAIGPDGPYRIGDKE